MPEPSENLRDRPLPRPGEILAQIQATDTLIQKAEQRYKARFERANASTEEAYAHLQGIRDHYKHKKLWSYFIMALMAGMIWFQSYLLYKVGIKAWDFSQYKWLLPALLVQNLAQIVGLAVFVVKALFTDLRREPSQPNN